jgi:hypothetical protein
MTNKWLNIRTQKPLDGQLVLMWNKVLAEINKRNGMANSVGIYIGHYIEALDELRPGTSSAFSCEWWMPLPEPPPRKRPKANAAQHAAMHRVMARRGP